MASTLNDKHEETYQEFYNLVNMEPKEIEQWLQTEQSQSVGQTKDGEDESVGHQSGVRIVDIKRTNKADLTDDKIAHMRKVCGYIKRHTAQRPIGDISESDWCYSLTNWGPRPDSIDPQSVGVQALAAYADFSSFRWLKPGLRQSHVEPHDLSHPRIYVAHLDDVPAATIPGFHV